MLVVGLTGGIASGKSSVSRHLSKLGAAIIDADKISREIVQPGEKAWKKIQEVFGVAYFLEDGHLNRKKMGNLVFSSKKELERLNSIMHPIILEKTEEYIEKYRQENYSLIVVDAALLLEVGMDVLVDEIWIVWIDREKQIERLMKRDSCSRERAENIIKSQMDTKEKMKKADRIIENQGSLELTLKKVEEIYKSLT